MGEGMGPGDWKRKNRERKERSQNKGRKEEVCCPLWLNHCLMLHPLFCSTPKLSTANSRRHRQARHRKTTRWPCPPLTRRPPRPPLLRLVAVMPLS